MTKIVDGEESKPINKPTQGISSKGVVKSFSIRRDDVMLHGPTENCRGCRAVVTNGKAVNHTPKCRDRFHRILKDSEDLRIDEQDVIERAVQESYEPVSYTHLTLPTILRV